MRLESNAPDEEIAHHSFIVRGPAYAQCKTAKRCLVSAATTNGDVSSSARNS